MRRLPVGAEYTPLKGTHFRVWAPNARRIDVVFDKQQESAQARSIELTREDRGYFSIEAPGVLPGSLYTFSIDGSSKLLPDPASRYQPSGPLGPSQVIDSMSFPWSDDGWPGVIRGKSVVYELHIGTFTREGTWGAASQHLEYLSNLGITVIEMMPVADYPGEFGWGYDGVNLFAPSRNYGSPDDLRRFIDSAHAVGIAVILDVVYNHFGPIGNFLDQYSRSYFTDKYENEWGRAINFDGEDAGPVREFFLANVEYWINEFHFDGFRLDATQQIFDASLVNIMTEICERARACAPQRSILIVGENEPQNSDLVRSPAVGGNGLDCLWNDDFHHSLKVALTGHNEAYYTDYLGKPQEFISAAKWGYLYQGQRYKWQAKPRGVPGLDLPAGSFLWYMQNHDQIANSARGLRIHDLTGLGSLKAATALLLLGPAIPMLFQGQEFLANCPFFYFADFEEPFAREIKHGRGKFLTQFRSYATSEVQDILTDPARAETFERSKIDHEDRDRNSDILQLHKDLLQLRRTDSTFCLEHDRRTIDGAVLGEEAFLLRFFGNRNDDRLLVVNFGRDLHLDPAPEPLLAPPRNHSWNILLSTEDVKYRGHGVSPIEGVENWRLPGCAAVVLDAVSRQ